MQSSYLQLCTSCCESRGFSLMNLKLRVPIKSAQLQNRILVDLLYF